MGCWSTCWRLLWPVALSLRLSGYTAGTARPATRMRHQAGRQPRLPCAEAMAGSGALLTAVVAVAVAGCASESHAVRPPAVLASGRGGGPAGQPAGVAPAGTAPPLQSSVPVWVQIPAIAVDSPLTGLGLQHDGTMQTPPAGFPAGWYTGAPTPGQLGPAIIAGHVDWAGHPGVFYNLRDLKPGDRVFVARTDGRAAVFRVSRVEEFAKDAFPTGAVYGNIDHAGLRLITCGGSFDQQAASYRDNIVAFADLVSTQNA